MGTKTQGVAVETFPCQLGRPMIVMHKRGVNVSPRYCELDSYRDISIDISNVSHMAFLKTRTVIHDNTMVVII